MWWFALTLRCMQLPRGASCNPVCAELFISIWACMPAYASHVPAGWPPPPGTPLGHLVGNYFVQGRQTLHILVNAFGCHSLVECPLKQVPVAVHGACVSILQQQPLESCHGPRVRVLYDAVEVGRPCRQQHPVLCLTEAQSLQCALRGLAVMDGCVIVRVKGRFVASVNLVRLRLHHILSRVDEPAHDVL